MVAKTKKKKKSRRSRRRRVQLTRATTLSQESHLSRAQSEGLNLSAGFIRLIYLRILFLLAALFFFSPFSRARPRRGEARRGESSRVERRASAASRVDRSTMARPGRGTEVTAPILLWKQRFFTAARDFASPFQRNFLRNIIYHRSRENRTDFDTDFRHIDR